MKEKKGVPWLSLSIDQSSVMVDEGEEGGSMAVSEHRPSYKICFMLK
jgi:hypothetical protein